MNIMNLKKPGLNKKATSMAINIIVVAIIVLVVAYVLIRFSTGSINDASDEFEGLLNKYTADCDHDHDGLKNSKDVCPCDHDDNFDSRTYYVMEATGCEVEMRCKYKTNEEEFIARFSQCADEEVGTGEETMNKEQENYEYYFAIEGECEKALKKASVKDIKQAYPNSCKDIKEEDDLVVFPQSCADKILATNKETGEPAFTCKTATKECKKILKEPC